MCKSRQRGCRGIRLHSWGRKIGVVPQEALLCFPEQSVRICSGVKPDASEKKSKALEIAQAKEVVDRLPQGLVQGKPWRPGIFPGGQRQPGWRLPARWWQSRKFWFLDDSASALDFATDAALLKRALRSPHGGMTVFMVSPAMPARYRNIADQIVIMVWGKAVGIRTYEQLFENCRTIQEICLSQMRGKSWQGWNTAY